MSGYGKRTFAQIQFHILQSLKAGPMSINDIATKAGVNWNTTKRQLTLLKGSDLVREAFAHRRLIVFELTQKGTQKVMEL